ncbi:hypothetical protein A1O3_10121, partial [Capronia epimyces CBS 606.96]
MPYDGMSLLSGHSYGDINRWDATERRVLNKIASLGQPVTNIEMLKPGDFPKLGEVGVHAAECRQAKCRVPLFYQQLHL